MIRLAGVTNVWIRFLKIISWVTPVIILIGSIATGIEKDSNSSSNIYWFIYLVIGLIAAIITFAWSVAILDLAENVAFIRKSHETNKLK